MSLPLIAEEQLEQIFVYFPELTEHQRQQMIQLFPLYNEWNAKINVISRKDIDNLYLHHVLHSLGIAKLVTLKPGSAVLDVGTGGGFPSIPLAILFPKTQFHLVDSIGKKIKVVQAVSEALKLTNVRAEHARAEQIKGQYDFIVTRAVGRLGQLHQWVHRKIKVKSLHDTYNGLICLKGGHLEEELQASHLNYAVYPITDFFKDPYFEAKYIVYVPL